MRGSDGWIHRCHLENWALLGASKSGGSVMHVPWAGSLVQRVGAGAMECVCVCDQYYGLRTHASPL